MGNIQGVLWCNIERCCWLLVGWLVGCCLLVGCLVDCWWLVCEGKIKSDQPLRNLLTKHPVPCATFCCFTEIIGMLTTMPILIVCAKLAPKGIEACVSLNAQGVLHCLGTISNIVLPPAHNYLRCSLALSFSFSIKVYSFLTMATNISFTIGNSFSNIIAAKVGITQTNFDALWCLIVMSAGKRNASFFVCFLIC